MAQQAWPLLVWLLAPHRKDHLLRMLLSLLLLLLLLPLPA
jgi:hypothetical protein